MEAIREYFRTTTDQPAAVEWRVKCYEDGQKYAGFIEANHFSLRRKRVLDLACGWGGHAMAFARRDAAVTASDLNDHAFDKLRGFCAMEAMPIDVYTADCQQLPFSGPYDVILALDLIEHIPDPVKFAAEIRRLLAPNGVCILTTPAKFLSAVWGEPHWHMRGLSLLPFFLQRPIAQLFGKAYPFPIERQYWHVGQLQRLFKGFTCTPVAASRKLPVASVLWGFVVISPSLYGSKPHR